MHFSASHAHSHFKQEPPPAVHAEEVMLLMSQLTVVCDVWCVAEVLH